MNSKHPPIPERAATIDQAAAIDSLAKFTLQITTTKLGRGHYRIDRADGYSIEVRRSNNGYWYQVSNLARRKSLAGFQFDMMRGYMPRDQIATQED